MKQRDPGPTKPPILSPSFKYIPAASTDVAATFQRIREQLSKEKKHGNR